MIYGYYLLIDTHLVKETMEVDDYILGSLIIYWDIIYIFLRILAILASSKND